MRERLLPAALAGAVGLALTGLIVGEATASELVPRTIDLNAPYRPADYRFLDEAIGERPLVALGESIHVTREMPQVRLNLARYLHEEKGFGVLAFEGSLIDAWTAQEHAYASDEAPDRRAATFKREALFGLWQTAPMEEVVAYALSTQQGPNPLYLTSFDLQPGMARAYGASVERSLTAFLQALHDLDASVDDRQLQAWVTDLAPALDCRTGAKAPTSLEPLEAWIRGPVALAVAGKRPAIHLAALKLTPSMLHARLRHCDEWLAAGKSMRTYQESRDALNAQMALALLGASPKLILWAHHSHLAYNSLGRSIPSMGQHLRGTLGDRLYTVGVFAMGGAAMDSAKADTAKGLAVIGALAAQPLPKDGRFSAERALAALSRRDLFVDLQGAPAEWATPRSSRLERAGRMPTALSKDFDGAVLLHRVHGAELDFLAPGPRALIRLASWIYQHLIIVAVLALAGMVALGGGIFRLMRTRRRRAR